MRTVQVSLVFLYATSSAFGGEVVFTAKPTAVTDGDRVNRRVVRADLRHAAEETCQIK